MMKRYLILILCCLVVLSYSQNLQVKIESAVKKFYATSGGKSAQIGISIRDLEGNIIAQYQAEKGFAPASTQKLFTAAYALSMLGENFSQTCRVGYTGRIEQGILKGNLILHSDGDPTLGSWRYPGKSPDEFLEAIYSNVKRLGIKEIQGSIVGDESFYDIQSVPGGWPADDIGNYYGAGIWGLNWRENQYEAHFVNGKLISSKPSMSYLVYTNKVKALDTQKTDESIIYSYPLSKNIFINGKIPSGGVDISGSIPHPAYQVALELTERLTNKGIRVLGEPTTYYLTPKFQDNTAKETEILVWYSPTLRESIPYFLRKSINLYGESYIKSVAVKQKVDSDTKSASLLMQKFWEQQGIPRDEIFFIDGSGLSPQNFISPNAFSLLLYKVKKEKWFPLFYSGLNTYRTSLRLKSGTIKNTKGYAGYAMDSKGKEYEVVVLTNNYTGENVGEYLLDIIKLIE